MAYGELICFPTKYIKKAEFGGILKYVTVLYSLQ